MTQTSSKQNEIPRLAISSPALLLSTTAPPFHKHLFLLRSSRDDDVYSPTDNEYAERISPLSVLGFIFAGLLMQRLANMAVNPIGNKSVHQQVRVFLADVD